MKRSVNCYAWSTQHRVTKDLELRVRLAAVARQDVAEALFSSSGSADDVFKACKYQVLDYYLACFIRAVGDASNQPYNVEAHLQLRRPRFHPTCYPQHPEMYKINLPSWSEEANPSTP